MIRQTFEVSTKLMEFAGKAEDLLNTIDKNTSRMLEAGDETSEDASLETAGEDLPQEESDILSSDSTDGDASPVFEESEESFDKSEALSRIQSLDQQILLKNNLLKEAVEESGQLRMEIKILVREHEDYKLKAQKILAEKDRIISQTVIGGSVKLERSSLGEVRDEIKQMMIERNSLREEAGRLSRLLNHSQSTISDLEKSAVEERQRLQEDSTSHKNKLEDERNKRLELEKELEYQLKEIHTREEMYFKEQANYLQSIETRDAEIERMQKQLSNLESPDSPGRHSSEKRIKDLAMSLVDKQATISNLLSEKTSLFLRIDKLESELRAIHAPDNRLAHRYSSSNQPEDLSQVYVESPFDSGVTRRVKRAYSSIDSFSIWIGIFVRRYPLLQMGIIAYGIFLHLWVCTVLYNSVPDASE